MEGSFFSLTRYSKYSLTCEGIRCPLVTPLERPRVWRVRENPSRVRREADEVPASFSVTRERREDHP